MKKSSTRKPATFTLDSSADARKFMARVCDPVAERLIEEEGTLGMFDVMPDAPFYTVLEAVPSEDEQEIRGAIDRLWKAEHTRDIARLLETAIIGVGSHKFDVGYLLGLAVGRKIGCAR